MNDNSSKAHLLSEIKEKRIWRSKRLREFVLLQRNTNTFIKELASHETLLKDFDINEMDLLLKTENLGEDEPFFEEIDHSIERNKAKIALKAKISNLLSNSTMPNHEEIFFFDAKKKGKNSNDNHLLYDYFIENKRKLIMQNRQNKNAKKIHLAGKKDDFIETITEKKEEIEEFQLEKEALLQEFTPNSNHFTLPCLEQTPLRKIKERMHFFINIPESFTARNSKNSETLRKTDIKNGFFSERRGYYKSKIQDFDDLEIGNSKKNNESFKMPLDKIREILPLKYRSREIYQKILQKNKRVRGLREKTGLSQSLSIKMWA